MTYKNECLVCKKIFEGRNQNQRYCSSKCNDLDLKRKSRIRNFKQVREKDRIKRYNGNYQVKSKGSVKITDKNIDLYCKLSQIIRGKPCRSKIHVLKQQNKELHRKVIP